MKLHYLYQVIKLLPPLPSLNTQMGPQGTGSSLGFSSRVLVEATGPSPVFSTFQEFPPCYVSNEYSDKHSFLGVSLYNLKISHNATFFEI